MREDDVRRVERTVDHLASTTPEHPRAQKPAQKLAHGSAIGRYLVLEWLGEGGMGVVYAAYDPQLDRKIALKVVRDVDKARDPARMIGEAQALAKLAHPNVVAVHDVGTTSDGQLFIAMELVDGHTLAAWLALAPRTTDEILHIFAQAGRGLAAAHRAGLVHRDFKPDNVLVGKDGRARVVDFGLVRAIRDVADGDAAGTQPRRSSRDVVTQADVVVGTPLYMAPEQVLQAPVDARTDQYSFCVSLYEALGDVRPFAGNTFDDIAEQILSGRVAEPRSSRKVPARVRDAIERGMRLEPADRFATMDQLLAALAHQGRARRRRRRNVTALAAALLAGGVAAMLWQRHADESARCDTAAAALDDVWGPQHRAKLERAFVATGLPFARTQLASTVRALDDYARAWTASYEESCRATHVRHEQSSEMLDQRTACLRSKRTALATLVDLLATADPQLVEKAHRSVAELPPIEACDASVLAAPIEPRDAFTAALVAHQRDVLATTHAMFTAGKYREALPRVEAAYAAARMLGYGPLLAEASQQLGKYRSRTGDVAGAARAFIEAFGAAAAGRSDDTAMWLAIHLATISADRQAFEHAHAWLDTADIFAKRLDDPPTARVGIHHARGYVLSEEGHLAASAHEYERSTQLRELTAPGSLGLGMSLLALAAKYDELGRYDDARAAADRAVALQLSLVGPDHPEMAIVLNIVGNIASDQGDLDAAERYYQRALAVVEPTPGKDAFVGRPVTAANVITNLGNLASVRGRQDDALALHRRALAIYEQSPANAPSVALSLGNIGSVLLARDDVAGALAAYERSLVAAESSLAADHPYVGDALVGIGECRVRLRRFADARPALERALAIRSRGARPQELADVQIALAKSLLAAGERTRAIELAQAARTNYAASPTSKQNLADVDAWLRRVPRG